MFKYQVKFLHLRLSLRFRRSEMSPYLCYKSRGGLIETKQSLIIISSINMLQQGVNGYTVPCTSNIQSTGHTDLPGHYGSIAVAAIIDLLVIIHPDLSQAHLVASDDLRALGEGVRALGAENVAHHRTRHDL